MSLACQNKVNKTTFHNLMGVHELILKETSKCGSDSYSIQLRQLAGYRIKYSLHGNNSQLQQLTSLKGWTDTNSYH